MKFDFYHVKLLSRRILLYITCTITLLVYNTHYTIHLFIFSVTFKRKLHILQENFYKKEKHFS